MTYSLCPCINSCIVLDYFCKVKLNILENCVASKQTGKAVYKNVMNKNTNSEKCMFVEISFIHFFNKNIAVHFSYFCNLDALAGAILKQSLAEGIKPHMTIHTYI